MASICDQLDNLPDDPVQRTEVLRLVACTLRRLWSSDPKATDLELIARKVGNVARAESNRLPLGESGLLDIICFIASAPEVSTGLIVECLRIIGNSSADRDENRARVVASGCLSKIISLLANDSMLQFAIPVLFNICVDYEPAQKAIYQAGISHQLTRLLTWPMTQDAGSVLTYINKLLGFVAAQGKKKRNPEHQVTQINEQPVDADTEFDPHLVPLDAPYILLRIATKESISTEAEEYMSSVSVALTYLTHDQFQRAYLTAPDSITLILNAFARSCLGFEMSKLDTDEQAQLKKIQTTFTATLADLSAQPSFTSSCALDGQEVQILHSWISLPYIPLQSGACLALGNIARSYETCTYLVKQSAIHTPLIAILSDPSNVDMGLLHSVLSFLKNLVIPVMNRPILGDAGLLNMNVLPRIWDIDTQPQVQFDAVSLTRLLVAECPENVRRICAPLDDDPASPEHTRSRLHKLMDLNKRSDHEPTVMETGRITMTICRVLHSNYPPSINPTLPCPSGTTQPLSLETFYANHGIITEAIIGLVKQTKYPTLRTEALLVFALMARTAAGAAVIAQALHQPEPAALITQLAAGAAPSPQEVNNETTAGATNNVTTPSETNSETTQTNLETQVLNAPIPTETPTAPTAADRENTLGLIALLMRCPEQLPAALRVLFERLLRRRISRPRGERVL